MKRKLLLTLTLATALLPTTLRAEETNHWRFDTSLNLFLAGLSGDVTVKGQPASADASFGDIVENLKFAAAGRLTVGHDRWSLSTEFSYMKLEVSTTAADVELKQWLVEPSVGYRFCDSFEGFVGARYNSIDGTVNFTSPLGVVRGGTQDWWDPIVGANLSLPLSGQQLPSTDALTLAVSASAPMSPGRPFRISTGTLPNRPRCRSAIAGSARTTKPAVARTGSVTTWFSPGRRSASPSTSNIAA
jgi:hypothetical protein